MKHGSARRAALVSLAAVALLAAGCGLIGPRAGSKTPAEILAEVPAFTPEIRTDKVETYRGEELYNYMNGAAVTYLEHRLRFMAGCDAFAGETQAKVELYELADPGNAKALYEQFAAGGKPSELAAGEAGCFWAGFEPEAIFRRGPYFVRILAYAADAKTGEATARKVAEAVDRAIAAPGS